ncbi:MAG: hypothetical protein HQ541_18105 [Mariniphaga sp.]|nr:hypothetical protein [Mariniphaga sp.]
MKDSPTIPKDIDLKNDLDFDFLKELGIRYIEKLGGNLWTDYNTHDPGITILEMLCYAITDLSQRIDMPIENLLASEKDNLANMHSRFLSAIHILPTKPVSALDYRNLFAHIKGVKNSWIQEHNHPVYLKCDTDPSQWSYNPFAAASDNKTEFNLKGLNRIYIDLEEKADPAIVFENVKKAYHKNRNLCEDLAGIEPIPEQSICICAYIDIEPEADEELIYAKIIKAVEDYFSPPLTFYSLQEMYKRGYSTDEIFEGPVPWNTGCINSEFLKGGFLDHKELENAELRTEVRLSDLVRIIMAIKGVKVIKDISISGCQGLDNENKNWIICIAGNHKPKLCQNNSVFNFSKDLLPVGINKNRADKILADIREKEKILNESKIIEDVEFPNGEYMAVHQYDAMQEDFPKTYGISSFGVAASSTNKRKAEAKQLKAYLLFFDQVLANYFAQLSKVKDLLSVDENLKKLYVENGIRSILPDSDEYKDATQIYFSQPVKGVNGLGELLNEDEYPKNVRNAMHDATTQSNTDFAQETFYLKRNELLDHLIARFAERFGEYVFIMKMIDEENYQDIVLKAKVEFLNEYKKISCSRGTGFDLCYPEVWDTQNVSGAIKRIARLTGIEDYSRRNLLIDAIEIYDEKDKVEDGVIEYRWRIKNKDQILLSSSKHYLTRNAAYNEIFQTLKYALNKSNYKIKKTKSGNKTYFNLINPTVKDKSSEAWIIARRIAYMDKKSKSEDARDEIIAFLKKMIAEEEGLYMIEHILLRPDNYNKNHPSGNLPPDAESNIFMASCIESDCTSCDPVDPYSFRVTVVLPGWTTRFRNVEFRRYFEKIVRNELPAHILSRICWIGDIRGMVPDDDNNMLQLQLRYKLYLENLYILKTKYLLSTSEIETLRESLKNLVEQLNKLYTIYMSGRLYDCNADEKELDDNKIILGRTNIGNL